MRRITYFIITVLLISGCEKDDDIIISVPDDFYKNGVYVNVDPRMELLAIVQHFTTWAAKRHTKYDFNYLTVYPFPSIQAEKAFMKVTFISCSAAAASACNSP
jgi:hypothetical protein